MPCTRFVYLMTTLHITNIRLNASGRSQDFIPVMVNYMFAAEKASKYASLYKIVLLLGNEHQSFRRSVDSAQKRK